MPDFNNWSSFDIWKNACSQQSGCLGCPLSIRNTGKGCYTLTAEEIRRIMNDSRNATPTHTWDKPE